MQFKHRNEKGVEKIMEARGQETYDAMSEVEKMDLWSPGSVRNAKQLLEAKAWIRGHDMRHRVTEHLCRR